MTLNSDRMNTASLFQTFSYVTSMAQKISFLTMLTGIKIFHICFENKQDISIAKIDHAVRA